MLFPYRDVYPKISNDVFIAPNSAVIGDVVIGSESSVWFGTVIRGDVMPIRIGERTNLQDGTIVHVTGGEFEVFIGDDVLIGHRAIIHGAPLKDKCFVGMAASSAPRTPLRVFYVSSTPCPSRARSAATLRCWRRTTSSRA